jgi:uncharacterized protein YbjT (DUF2867 family)
MSSLTVLVVGATGSIGRPVLAEALAAGHAVRALVRDPDRARTLPAGAQVVIGDVTDPTSLVEAVAGIDAVVITLGSDGQGRAGARGIDYGGVRNLLLAIGHRPVRIALMTAIGVTNRSGHYNLTTEVHDWKRRSERLVRASGLEYTIVRPGWFDYNNPQEYRIVMLQGDRRQAGTPADGVIARTQIARVLVGSLTSDAARHMTLELVAEAGPEQPDLEPLFASLDADPEGSLDGASDRPNQPLDAEPAEVRADLEAMN